MRSAHWAPNLPLNVLRYRAQFISFIRQFFVERDYLEVDTPIMAKHGVTDVYIDNISASFSSQNYALQSSPEFHMKRLLASGSGPIFQISKAFRNDEQGRWHNPEFTLLEWYQLNITHYQLMDEVDSLLQRLLGCPMLRRLSYKELFEHYCEGINPHKASLETLAELVKKYQLTQALDKNEQDKDQYLFLLLAGVIEPQLSAEAAPLAVYDFPPSQASLAAINDGVAQRFEIYYKGVELANGFLELCDAVVQQKRFEQDNTQRMAMGRETKTIDSRLIAALEHGLPPCSGVALGVDRLLALALNRPCLEDVIAFTINNA